MQCNSSVESKCRSCRPMHPALQVLQCRAILYSVHCNILASTGQIIASTAMQCNVSACSGREHHNSVDCWGQFRAMQFSKAMIYKAFPLFLFLLQLHIIGQYKRKLLFFCNGAILHSLTFTIAIEQQIALNCLLHSGQMSIQCNSDEFVFDVFVFVFSKYLYLYFLVLDKSLQQG